MSDMRNAEATSILIYEHTRAGPARQLQSLDAMDAKAAQIFAAATVVLGFGAFSASSLTGIARALYVLAAVAYVIAGWKAFSILRMRQFRVTDGTDRWWPTHKQADAALIRDQMLDDLSSAYAENRDHLEAKGGPLNALLVSTAVETLFVAAAIVGAAT